MIAMKAVNSVRTYKYAKQATHTHKKKKEHARTRKQQRPRPFETDRPYN